MALPTASTLAASVKSTLAGLDPDGFGALSAADQNAIRDKLILALCTEVLAAIQAATVTVNGTTASACTAGGSTGTCSATGTLS